MWETAAVTSNVMNGKTEIGAASRGVSKVHGISRVREMQVLRLVWPKSQPNFAQDDRSFMLRTFGTGR
jgi:hypothetical protein